MINIFKPLSSFCQAALLINLSNMDNFFLWKIAGNQLFFPLLLFKYLIGGKATCCSSVVHQTSQNQKGSGFGFWLSPEFIFILSIMCPLTNRRTRLNIFWFCQSNLMFGLVRRFVKGHMWTVWGQTSLVCTLKISINLDNSRKDPRSRMF